MDQMLVALRDQYARADCPPLERVAELAGLPVSTTQRYLNGDVKRPDREKILMLSRAISADRPVCDPPPSNVPLPDDMADLSEEDMMHIQQIVDAMRESFDASLSRMHATYVEAVSQLRAEHQLTVSVMRTAIAQNRREKIIIFVLFVGVALLAAYELLFVDPQIGSAGLIRH